MNLEQSDSFKSELERNARSKRNVVISLVFCAFLLVMLLILIGVITKNYIAFVSVQHLTSVIHMRELYDTSYLYNITKYTIISSVCLAVFCVFMFTFLLIKYKINGKNHEGEYSFFFITNSSRIAGVSDVYYDVKLDDNKFEVLLCSISKRADIIKSLYFLTMYDVSKVPGIYSYKTDKLKIKFVDVPKKPWCVDGEKLDDIVNKYEITIDNSLRMMIPKKNVDKLFVKK